MLRRLTCALQLRNYLLSASEENERQLSELEETLDNNRYFVQMMFGVADHATTIAASTAGYCPASTSSLSEVVWSACSRNFCSDLVPPL